MLSVGFRACSMLSNFTRNFLHDEGVDSKGR